MPIAATDFVPFHRVSIENDEIEAVVEVLRSGWLTTGPRVREFETAFARYVGARHAVAVNSCTAALHLALAAIGVSEGDEVILPTMTFAATGEVALYFKARPVLVDCAPGTHHLDPSAVEKAITGRTKAIIPVHFGGLACDMDAILEIARAHKIKVIEDAAHALPTRYREQMVGSLGDVTCFSFYATKTITTGEGGMVTTDDPEYAERVRALSLHGISRDTWDRHAAGNSWRYEILEHGFKYNLTDIQAALGLAQLRKCDAMRARRAALAEFYTEALGDVDAFRLPEFRHDDGHAWHLYVVRVNPTALRIDRDQVIEELRQRGIGASVHFVPLHLHRLYRERLGYRTGQFPNAEESFEASISLPIYPQMTGEDAERVVEALQDVAREFRR